MVFGKSERLSPGEARSLITDLRHRMCVRAHDLARENEWDSVDSDVEQSPMEEHYGDAWKLIVGIGSGMDKIINSSYVIYEDGENKLGSEVKETRIDKTAWQEHYETYGYGPYGKGLKIGKRLAVYEDRGFEFTELESDESDDEIEFTFTE